MSANIYVCAILAYVGCILKGHWNLGRFCTHFCNLRKQSTTHHARLVQECQALPLATEHVHKLVNKGD